MKCWVRGLKFQGRMTFHQDLSRIQGKWGDTAHTSGGCAGDCSLKVNSVLICPQVDFQINID
jgi:hypothetical protein